MTSLWQRRHRRGRLSAEGAIHGLRSDIAAIARGGCAEAEVESRSGLERGGRRFGRRNFLSVTQANLLSQLVSIFAVRQTDRRQRPDPAALRKEDMDSRHETG